MLNDEKLKKNIRDIVLELKNYNKNFSTRKPIKHGYSQLYNVLFLYRSGEMIKIDYRGENFSITLTKYFITYLQNAIRYDMITDNDSLFAQSTVSDTRYITVQDCEILRNFYTRVTGHEFST